MKPMNKKSYGSIPHLLGSKMGVGDKRIHPGQHDIICKKCRKGDLIIAQEKVDGSCCAIYKDFDGKIHSLTRSGYTADSSPYKQHHIFAKWVRENEIRFYNLLGMGERLVGEWIIKTHGTKINVIHEPFVVFDLMIGDTRSTMHDFLNRIGNQFVIPGMIKIGTMTEKEILQVLNHEKSLHGQEKIEGIVFRVEREGRVDFLAKYVRHGYEAGKYMKDEIFNENWEKFL